MGFAAILVGNFLAEMIQVNLGTRRYLFLSKQNNHDLEQDFKNKIDLKGVKWGGCL